MKGGGRRRGERYLLPTVTVGWTDNGLTAGVDISVGFWDRHAWLEAWWRRR